jgi:glycosyltransferase involved in cell wall biosynthesis
MERQFFVSRDEFDFEESQVPLHKRPILDEETAVAKTKSDFFDLLDSIGSIRWFSQEDLIAGNLKENLSRHNAVLATFHEPPPEIPCRLLAHSKGGLMEPGGFLNGWTFRSATINLVETCRQREDLERSFTDLNIRLGVFPQQFLTETFRLPEETKQSPSNVTRAKTSPATIVYAGRFIPNKGIAQIVRALNAWPIGGIKVEFIGNFEPSFPLTLSGAHCATFERWFAEEVLRRNKEVDLTIRPALSRRKLAEYFWDADAFVCASFHEDEAMCNTAHEAVLSGLPAIVSDWCGLGELGRNTRGGAITTYPSYGGVRFSLVELRNQINAVVSKPEFSDYVHSLSDAKWVHGQVDRDRIKETMVASIDSLLKGGVEESGAWRVQGRMAELAARGPESFKRALAYTADDDPEGLYVPGTGYAHKQYSEARLRLAIQGLYTTYPEPPAIRPGMKLHGFWRIALWDSEMAIVEFGFPGPRLLHFSKRNWRVLKKSVRTINPGEVEFTIQSKESAAVLQDAVSLGYLVPNNLAHGVSFPQ